MKPYSYLTYPLLIAVGIVSDRLLLHDSITDPASHAASTTPPFPVDRHGAGRSFHPVDSESLGIAGRIREAKSVCVRGFPTLGERLHAIQTTLAEVAAFDGKRAVMLAAELLPPGELDAVLPGLMGKWGESSPEEALEWYQEAVASGTMPGGIAFDSKAALLEAAFKSIGQTDPEKALAFAAKLTTEAECKIALATIGKAAVLGGRQSDLLRCSVGITDDDQRFLVRSALLTQWASLQPSDASVGFSENLTGDEQALLASSVGHAWLRVQPEKAAAWWLENAPESERGDTMREIVNLWGALDPTQAAQWLNAQPESPEKDQGRASLAHNAFELDVESALNWAHSIQSSEQRDITWTNLLHTLYLRDPAYAKEILSRQDTPEECRNACASFVTP